MRRSILSSGRRCLCQRELSTHAATAAEVPNDPDILSTQPQEMSKTASNPDSGSDSPAGLDLSQKYPRLQYRRPALGVNPAYDLALDLIKQDRLSTVKKMQLTKAKMSRLNVKADSPLKESQLRDLAVYHRQLEDLLDMNDPEVRWRHARGDVDLSMPIYRYLSQKTWSEKALLLLMQRITQMSVTPDVIPIISPTVDVRLQFPGRTKGLRKGQFEVGEILTSLESQHMPSIEIQSFADETKKFSIALVDPDVPDEQNDSFTSYLHYLHTDVSLSSTEHAVEANNGTVVLPYIPPHPQKGTPNHRYTLVVWEQPATAPKPNAPLAGKHAIPRERFDAQKYAQQNGLHAVGMSFWRQVWDADVATVMQAYPDVKYEEKNFKRIKA